MTDTFKTEAPAYWENGDSVIPIVPNSKKAIPNFTSYTHSLPNAQTRDKFMAKYAHYGIGLLMGTNLGNGKIRVAFDVDDPEYRDFVAALMGRDACGKKGKKGETFFFSTDADVKSTNIKFEGKNIADILAGGRQTVLPPTLHPETGEPYVWTGRTLLETDPASLPYFSQEDLHLIKEIIKNPNHRDIMKGEGTHDAALSLMASLAGKFQDVDKVCSYVAKLLPQDYSGNLTDELEEMFTSALSKDLGKRKGKVYDPGEEGPIPVGYTANNYYVFMDQTKKILSIAAPRTLMSLAGLYDLAPASYWLKTFGQEDGDGNVKVNLGLAADTLMQKCREAGAFVADKVRGCGVWKEGGRLVLNLRGDVPVAGEYIYVRFLSLPEFENQEKVDAQKLLDWLNLFNWDKAGYSTLALGWAAIAVICGALPWRPHIFVNGPKNSGKSTIIEGLSNLLYPMSVTLDGASSEAGIRQSIGADSRPVIIDEFESDQDVGRMQRVVKMIRSASSAKGPIARGTPEGKALQFQLYSTFCLGAVNPLRGSAADQSRIVCLDLKKHDNDPQINVAILEGVAYLHSSRSAWSHQMLELAPVIFENINVFEKAMPIGDSRHTKNMAALMAGAFTVLHARRAEQSDAEAAIANISDVIQHLALAHEEDDSQDCLNHLLNYVPDTLSLGEVIHDARLQDCHSSDPYYLSLRQHGIKLTPAGILVANKHSGLERVFAGTVWASGAHIAALRRLPGAKADDSTRTRFSGGSLVRCTLIPYSSMTFDAPDPKAVTM